MRARSMWMLLVLVLAASVFAAQEKQETSEQPPPAAEQPAETEAAPAPQVPHTFNITPEEKARKNPLRFSEISVERGKKLYSTQCAMCHGDKGDGKGDLAVEMKIQPPDLSNPAVLDKRTDGELFTIIQTGSSVMPSQGKRMNDQHKWELVNYLRALSGKKPLKSTQEELHEGTVIVKENN